MSVPSPTFTGCNPSCGSSITDVWPNEGPATLHGTYNPPPGFAVWLVQAVQDASIPSLDDDHQIEMRILIPPPAGVTGMYVGTWQGQWFRFNAYVGNADVQYAGDVLWLPLGSPRTYTVEARQSVVTGATAAYSPVVSCSVSVGSVSLTTVATAVVDQIVYRVGG